MGHRMSSEEAAPTRASLVFTGTGAKSAAQHST